MISKNEIYNTGYSGVSVGWTWNPSEDTKRNNVIEYNRFYDYSVFLKIDPQAQYRRIETRNGAYAQQFFEKWIPLETSYFSETNVEARCDLVLDISLQSQSCAAKY